MKKERRRKEEGKKKETRRIEEGKKKEIGLSRLKEFLDEKNIECVIPKNAGKKGHSDLFLPSFRIYIKLQGEDDELFYKTHHIGVHPIFIRDGETPEFVLEKVQNTIIRIMQKKQAAFEKCKTKSLN